MSDIGTLLLGYIFGIGSGVLIGCAISVGHIIYRNHVTRLYDDYDHSL